MEEQLRPPSCGNDTMWENINAFDTLKKSMQEDESYAWSWHCNIAMSAFDEGVSHEISNKIAARFMKLCFDVDTTKFKYYQSFGYKS